MATVIDTVAHALERAGVRPRDRLLLGFSGGLDSTVLLEALARLRERFSFELLAHHVHHGLSAHADDWEAHCAARCSALSVCFESDRVTLSSHASGVEAAAREARHSVWAKYPADWWVSAHHRDDQAETVLFRLLRGTGVAGMAAMVPMAPGNDAPGRLRPLLALGRAQLHQAALSAGLSWIEDESNRDSRYTRNFLRLEVMPLLRERFKGADVTLARAARHFSDAAQMLDELAAMDLARCGIRPSSRQAFLTLSDARQGNLLRFLLREMDGRLPDERRLKEALRQVAQTRQESALCLPLGASLLHVYRDALWVTPTLPPVSDNAQPWPLFPSMDWGEGVLQARSVCGAGLNARKLDAARLSVRTRWSGCAMQLPGRPRKPFSQLAQEAGIAPVDRDRLPILCLDDVAVWMAGIGVAESMVCPPQGQGVELTWSRPGAFTCGPG